MRSVKWFEIVFRGKFLSLPPLFLSFVAVFAKTLITLYYAQYTFISKVVPLGKSSQSSLQKNKPNVPRLTDICFINFLRVGEFTDTLRMTSHKSPSSYYVTRTFTCYLITFAAIFPKKVSQMSTTFVEVTCFKIAWNLGYIPTRWNDSADNISTSVYLYIYICRHTYVIFLNTRSAVCN